MPIEFRCNSCNTLLRVPDESAGGRAQCPSCQTVLDIPAGSELATPTTPEHGAPYDTGPTVPQSDNPFQSPVQTGVFIETEPAPNKVSGPAIGLIVIGAIGIALHAIGLVAAAIVGPQAFMVEPEGLPDNAFFEFVGSGEFQVGSSILGVLRCVLVVYGGIRMKQLGNYGWAMAAAVLAVIPCLSGCCCLDLPFGIWAIVVLSDSQVKAAFNQALQNPMSM